MQIAPIERFFRQGDHQELPEHLVEGRFRQRKGELRADAPVESEADDEGRQDEGANRKAPGEGDERAPPEASKIDAARFEEPAEREPMTPNRRHVVPEHERVRHGQKREPHARGRVREGKRIREHRDEEGRPERNEEGSGYSSPAFARSKAARHGAGT